MISQDRVLLDRMDLQPMVTDTFIEDAIDGLKIFKNTMDSFDLEERARLRLIEDEFFGLCDYLQHVATTDMMKKEDGEIREFILSWEDSIKDTLLAHYEKSIEEMGEKGLLKHEVIEKKVFYQEIPNPKVSVIMPSMHEEDRINFTLKTLSMQTLEDIEIILIDVGSRDATVPIMREYAAVDERFQVIVLDGFTRREAVSFGEKVARGEYLVTVDVLDELNEDTLKEMYEERSGERLFFRKNKRVG